MEKEIECEIVQDLLLGYVDNTLNLESKKLVEKHLETCQECNERLKDIKEDNDTSEENKEIDYLKSINRKINNKNIFITIGSIFILIIVIFNISVFVNYSKQISIAEIFLDPEISDIDRLNIESRLRQPGENIEFSYISKEEHLKMMKESLGENAKLLDEYENNNIFPSSYKITAKPKVIKELQKEISIMQGVKTITSYADYNPYELYIMKIFSKEN